MNNNFFEVLRAGINTTYQDKGRFHMQHFGLVPGGCMDNKSFLIANALIGNKLAYVLTGGSKGGPFTAVDEQYLLDIERESFLSLCAEPKTQDRIKHTLTTGKPLIN